MEIFEIIWADLTDFPVNEDIYDNENGAIFKGTQASMWLSRQWWMVWLALACYIPMVFWGPDYMKSRERIYNKNLLFCWNTLLSAFSTLGFWFCLPKLLFSKDAGLLTSGLKATICEHPTWYANGYSGVFVYLFIVSKLSELIDTVWLVLGKRPVIFLHWYHHITVLLFCWHSYSKMTTIGVWFATINYGVHSIMYTYYSFTQWSQVGKKFVAPFAPYIMMAQMSQMGAGLAVIVANIYYSLRDPSCRHNWSNNVLGFLMYISYFYLFAQLYCNRFVNKKGDSKKKTKKKRMKRA